jgi:HK97 family phage portal protein
VELRGFEGPQLGIGDPALAEYLGIGYGNDSGVALTELSALELSAVWRSVLLTAGTVATLPLKSYHNVRLHKGGSRREQIESFYDHPHPDMTPFEWVELVMAHELLWGNSYLYHIRGGASQIVGLAPLVPWAVGAQRNEITGSPEYPTRDIKGTPKILTPANLLHVRGFGTDGLKGLSPIGAARHSLGTARAGDKAAGRMFRNGLLLGGILRPKGESLTKTQQDQVTNGLKRHAGASHAGDVAFVPHPIEFSPWTMSAEDAQFLETRQFGIEECSRWFGVPKELLAATGATSWGTGVSELVKAFARFGLSLWTSRLEQRFSMLLPEDDFCEFDYTGLLQPSPQEEIDLLIRQVEAKLLTVDEARAIRNLPPFPTTQQIGDTSDAITT